MIIQAGDTPCPFCFLPYAEANFNLLWDVEFSNDDNPENGDRLGFGVALSPKTRIIRISQTAAQAAPR